MHGDIINEESGNSYHHKDARIYSEAITDLCHALYRFCSSTVGRLFLKPEELATKDNRVRRLRDNARPPERTRRDRWSDRGEAPRRMQDFDSRR